MSAWDGTEYGEASLTREFSVDVTAPSAITDLVAETGSIGGKIDLSWTAPKEDISGGAASRYLIRYATYSIVNYGGNTTLWWNSSGDVSVRSPVPYPPKGPGHEEGMTVTGLMPGVTYWFSIKSKDEAENISAMDSTAPQAKAKAGIIGAAPTNALLDNINTVSMRLRWTDNSAEEDRFGIQKSINGIGYTTIGTVGQDVMEYTGNGMTNLSVNRRYWYRVCAYKVGIGSSSYADAPPRYTLANKPGAPSVVSDYDGTNHYHTDITIAGSGNPVGTEYCVYIGTQSVQSNGTLSGTEYWDIFTGRLHKDLIPETMYVYTVKARNGDLLTTAMSDSGSAVTLSGPGKAYRVLLEASMAELTAGGSSSALLTATVKDVPGGTVTTSTAAITFTIDASTAPGRLPGGTTTYVVIASNGIATAILTSTTDVGSAGITAGSPGVIQDLVIIDVKPGEPVRLSLNKDRDTIVTNDDGASGKSGITARIVDANDNNVLIATGTVKYFVYCGNLEREDKRTEKPLIDGEAKFTYTDTKAGIMTIKARYGNFEASAEVTSIVKYGNEVEVLARADNGKTRIVCPWNVFNENAEIDIKIVSDEEASEYSIKNGGGAMYLPGTAREFNAYDVSRNTITFNEGVKLIVYIPYNDSNRDNILDDINMPVQVANGNTTLRAFVLNENTGDWEQHPDWPTIDKEACTAMIEVEHFSKYCLMAAEGELDITEVFNYPNPFSESTVFSFNFGATASNSKINIYTISGRLIKTIKFEGKFGNNEVEWDGQDGQGAEVGNGLYLYKIVAETGAGKTIEAVGKMVLMR